jgi:hypothetical protein
MPNILRRLRLLLAPVTQDATGLDAPPSRLDVINAYRLIYGRNPESEATILAHLRHASLLDLRLALFNTPEFVNAYTRARGTTEQHPDVHRARGTLVYIHLLKCGGTSLRTFLQAQFPPERVCPIHWNQLHQLPAAVLGQFDYFSGHFDHSSVRLIPRDRVNIVAMFRQPRARLISWYRALRTYPASGEFSGDRNVALANSLDAEQFFESEPVRGLPETNNYYLMAFGRTPSGLGGGLPRLSAAELDRALETAKRNIHALTSLGITERFDQSVELICRDLGFAQPGVLPALNVTNEIPGKDARCRTVDEIGDSPRLARALADLTRYDDELYRLAVTEFEARRAALAPVIPLHPRLVIPPQ